MFGILKTRCFVVALILGGLLRVSYAGELSRIQDWLDEVESSLSREDAGHSLLDLLEEAQRNDEQLARLRSHLEVIKRSSEAGRSWPDPEIRVGFGEDEKRGRSEREIGIRFRIPKRMERKRLKQIEAIDTEWTHDRIDLRLNAISIEVKESFVSSAFSRLRLLNGIQRMRSILEYEALLKRMEEEGQVLAYERAGLIVDIASLHVRLSDLFSEYEKAIGELSTFGMDRKACESLLSQCDVDGWAVPQIIGKDAASTIAARNDSAVLEFERDDLLFAADLDSRSSKWLPEPSFAQVEWGELDQDGIEARSDEWGVRAGFTIGLFEGAERKLLSAARKETSHQKSLSLIERRNKVETVWEGLNSTIESEEGLDFVFEYASGVLKKVMQADGPARGPSEGWKSQEAYFELRENWIDRKNRLYGSCVDLERVVGESIFEYIK